MPQTQKLSIDETQRLVQLVKKTRLDYRLSQYETAALKEINKSVLRARREIGRKLETVKPGSVFTRDRLNALADEMQDLTAAVRAQITGGITQVATSAGAASYAEHNAIFSFGGRVPNFNPVTLSAAQLHSMVVKTPIGGKLLNEWVEDSFSRRLQKDFKSQIMTGMLQGEGYPALVKRFDRGVYQGLETDMETLTRSYVQSVNVQAMEDVAKANADIVKGMRWNATAENRTCIACMSLSAKDEIYPLDGGPDMPLHILCRCFWEIVTKTFREMGVDVDEIEKGYKPYTIRGTVDPVTGKITPGKIGVGNGKIISVGRFLGDYNSFFKGLPENVQLQMLGPTRLGLYKSGKVKLKDLADKNGKIRLLTELGVVRKGGKFVGGTTTLLKKEPWENNKEKYRALTHAEVRERYPSVPSKVIDQLGTVEFDALQIGGRGSFVPGQGLNVIASTESGLLHEIGHVADNVLSDRQVVAWEKLAAKNLEKGLYDTMQASQAGKSYYIWENLYSSFSMYHKKASGFVLTAAEEAVMKKKPEIFTFIKKSLARKPR